MTDGLGGGGSAKVAQDVPAQVTHILRKMYVRVVCPSLLVQLITWVPFRWVARPAGTGRVTSPSEGSFLQSEMIFFPSVSSHDLMGTLAGVMSGSPTPAALRSNSFSTRTYNCCRCCCCLNGVASPRARRCTFRSLLGHCGRQSLYCYCYIHEAIACPKTVSLGIPSFVRISAAS